MFLVNVRQERLSGSLLLYILGYFREKYGFPTFQIAKSVIQLYIMIFWRY